MTKRTIQDLITPSALIDLERLENNISDMATRAEEYGVHLRPHIKTHKCIEIAKKQEEAGAKGITVSTLGEAVAFVESGFSDITYAVPLAPDKFEGVHLLSRKSHLKVLVDHPKIVNLLGAFCKEVEITVDVLLKVDCGYPRCGINPESSEAISLVKMIYDSPNLIFKGILTHAGHSYTAATVEEIKGVAKQEQDVMIRFAKTLKAERTELAPEVVSIGSTPTVRLADTFQEGITEIRPGNYAFFDYTQVALGVCDVTDCAFTVLSSIIGSYSDRAVIDAGATALSKDLGPTHMVKNPGYGQIIEDYSEGQLARGAIISSLSQEHGKIVPSDESGYNFTPGEKIRIIPNHSCLTANLFEHYHIVKGDVVIDRWKVQRSRFD